AASDPRVFRNFYEAPRAEGLRFYVKPGERGPARASRVVLPQVGRCRRGRLELDVASRDWEPPLELVVLSGGTAAHAMVQGAATLGVDVADPGFEGADLEVALLAPGVSTDPDRRAHGVYLKRVAWTPLGWTWAPPRQMALLPALAAWVAAVLLLLRLRPV